MWHQRAPLLLLENHISQASIFAYKITNYILHIKIFNFYFHNFLPIHYLCIFKTDTFMQKLPIKISLDDSFFEPEELCGHYVTRQSKQHWAVILDLMVEFDRVCKEHGITYFLDSGTLLGAVRHNGFIPWDDDADMIMSRSEYEKLCAIAPTAFKEPYFWQTNETDPGSLRRHGQLRNSLTSCILKAETRNGKANYRFNQGIFLDVFILDEVPDDAEELARFRKELRQQLRLLFELKDWYRIYHGEPWIEKIQKIAYDKFEATVSRYNGTGQKRIANISLLPETKEKEFFIKSLYDDCVDYTFEGFSFSGPKEYDALLSGQYGDWHQFVKGTGWHDVLIMDCYRPYTEYFEEPTNPAEEESTIAFFEKKTARLKKQKRFYKKWTITLAVVSAIAVIALICSLCTSLL
jgi:lipopolysaccharide cholinephosphotransferase